MKLIELDDSFKDARGLEIDPNATYVVFVDESAVNLDSITALHTMLGANADIVMIPVKVPLGKVIADVISAYGKVKA